MPCPAVLMFPEAINIRADETVFFYGIKAGNLPILAGIGLLSR